MQMSRAIDRDRVHLVSVPAASAVEVPVSPVALFPALDRGKWQIAAAVLIALLIGGCYAYILATPLYRSTAVLKLAPHQDQIVDFQSAAGRFSRDAAEVNSEVEVLRARGLMQQVVARLDLMTDPEFNQELRGQSVVGRMASWAGIGAAGGGFSRNEKEQRVRDGVISKLLEAVTIRNIPLSLVFQISVVTEDARKSALIADTIVDLYISNQIKTKFEATEQATLWLTERVAALQAKLEGAEAKASDFSAETELVSVEALRGLELQIKDLRERITMAETMRARQSSKIVALETAATPAEQVKVSADPQLEQLLSGGAYNPEMTVAFDARFQSILQQSRQELARFDQQLAALRASEAELSAQVSRQNEDLIALQQLSREADAARVLYEHFLSRLNETSAQQGNQRADSRILSDAVVPHQPSAPRRGLILAMSAVFGLLSSVGLILLREMRYTGSRTLRDLEAATGCSVLGQIPKMPAKAGADVLRYLADRPMSAVAEAIRDLRSSLLRLNGGSPPQVIVCTSSVPGEGKAVASLALAQSLCGLGKSVLLVEADSRGRGLEQPSRLPNNAVLQEGLSLSEAVHRPDGFDADVLSCDGFDTHAADLFASDRFQTLMEEARQTYDAVIIDAPPLLLSPDARIIAEQADALLFTVRWDRTSRGQVEEAMRLIHYSGQRITGLVLSQFC
jgi:uncharacterized protein involved in exopolysaccharide biosynthesis/Mrp family chromosome partitioning ATPase